MRDIYELRREEALDLLADIIEPATEIMSDKDIAEELKNEKMVKAVSTIIKKHKKSVLEIMARIEGESPETYSPNILQLPFMVLMILNNKELIELFRFAGRQEETNSYIGVSENTTVPNE